MHLEERTLFFVDFSMVVVARVTTRRSESDEEKREESDNLRPLSFPRRDLETSHSVFARRHTIRRARAHAADTTEEAKQC